MNPFKQIFYFFCSACRPNQSSTIRFAFPLVFTALAFVGAAALITSTESYIRIESSANSVRAGDVFSVNVYVSAHVPVNAIDLTLDFSREQVKILGIDTGESVITLWTVDPYVDKNKVILRGGTFRKGFLGEHLIATVNMRATDTGLAQFEISKALLLAGDGAGTKVKISDSGKQTEKMYIANADGTYALSAEPVSSLQGNVVIRIITDIDGDGIVTLADVSAFMAAWFHKNTIFDFNGDGKMNFRDFSIILSDSFFR